MFEAFYASSIQHPLLLWCAALAALGYALTRAGLTPALRRYCLGLGVLSIADAWLTSGTVAGIGRLEGAAATVVPLFFVLAGDLRFLLVVTLGTPDGDLRVARSRIRVATAFALIVPIFSQLVVALLPASMAAPRVLFLVYELSFFALTCVLMRVHPGPRRSPWVRDVARFVLLYYGLWATADAIILFAGADWGYGLRVLPNLLYYGGLIAAIGGLASRASRASASTSAAG